jgi:hypothetical protein
MEKWKKERNKRKISQSIGGRPGNNIHHDQKECNERKERETVVMLYWCCLPQAEKGDGGGRNGAVESHLT